MPRTGYLLPVHTTRSFRVESQCNDHPSTRKMPPTPSTEAPSTPTLENNGGDSTDVPDEQYNEAVKRLEKSGKAVTRDNEHWRKILEEDDEVR